MIISLFQSQPVEIVRRNNIRVKFSTQTEEICSNSEHFRSINQNVYRQSDYKNLAMSFDFNRELVKQWEPIDNLYAIDRKTLLGKDSYGQVYRGYSFQRDCLVGIKIVSRNNNDRKEIATLDALSSLKHHYVMSYYGHIVQNKQILHFLQYCPNGTLKSYLQHGLTQPQVLRLFRQLVEGMCYLNAKKKTHRNLRPENILIGPEEDIKIADFGLPQPTASQLAKGETSIPVYAAPQLYLNKSKTEKWTENCDVWSTGLILYEMLTGEPLLKQAYQQNSSELLKQSWIQFHKGFKVVNLNQKYHPLWGCFINWLLDFDARRRPTFSALLETIKSIYKEFSDQLKKGVVTLQPSLQKFQNYVQFNINKYQILLNLCETFTSKDISLRNQFKYLIMFCCLMRYISFNKTFVRNLTNKKLQYNNQQLIDQSQFNHPYIDMLIKKSEILLDLRYDFYSQQLKVTIIPKILSTYCQRQQSQPILYQLDHIVKLAIATSKGQNIESEETYEQALKSILPVIQNVHKNVTTYFKQSQLKIYYQMLIAMQLSEQFPIQKHMEKDLFSNQTSRVNRLNYQEVINEINYLKDHIF